MMFNRLMRRGSSLLFMVTVLMLLALGACTMMGGAASSGDIPEVTIEKTDTGYTIPSEVPSGVVALKWVGEGEGLPARLNEGVTMEQLNEALTQPDPFAMLSLVSLLGGASNTTDDRLIVDLQPGQHVVIDFPEDGPPMVYPFTAGEASGAAAPAADVTVDLVDFNFAIPAEITTGSKVWQINNKGQQWHEMAIVRLGEGVTMDDVLAMLASEEPTDGPPPFEEIAFWAPNSPGETGYVTLDLPPGEYTVLCFLPDLAGDMSAHAAHGMVASLVVTE